MRSDMKKLLREDTYGKKRGSYSDVRHTDKGSIQSMRKPYGYDRKGLGYRTSPFKNYLRKQVGRPWNDVWSDICKKSDYRSFNGHILRECVDWYVTLHCEIREDGEVYQKSSRRWRYDMPVIGLYVHPVSGLLSFNHKRSRKYPRENTYKVYTVNGVEYFKFDDVWYEVKMADIPYVNQRFFVYDDVFLSDKDKHSFLVIERLRQLYGKSNVYAIYKRQIGKKTIKRIKMWLEKQGLS